MWLIRKNVFHKIAMLKFATLGAAITAFPILIIPAEYYMLSSFFLIASTFFGELGIVVYWALPADCADYCQLKFNKKMAGVLGAVALFSQKFAMSLVGAGIGFILSWVSYQPGAAVTPAVANGILVITAVLPIACHIISYYFLGQYELDESAVDQIHSELEVMYAEAEAAS